MTPHSSESVGRVEDPARLPAFSNSVALVDQQRGVAAVVNDLLVRARPVRPRQRLSVHHQYSSSVSPFQAKTANTLGVLRSCPLARRPTAAAA